MLRSLSLICFSRGERVFLAFSIAAMSMLSCQQMVRTSAEAEQHTINTAFPRGVGDGRVVQLAD